MKAARIQDDIVMEVVEIPEGVKLAEMFHEEAGFVEVEGNVEPGMLLKNNEFHQAPEPEFDEEAAWARLRAQRNHLLRESDWTQLADIPEATQEKWRKYRETLRGFPATVKDIRREIKWPKEPK